MLIFKILTTPQWAALERDGETTGVPVDLADGFVHFSTRQQVAGTAAKHFAGQAGLMLLAVETDRLDNALKWEPSRGGDSFPHLYGPLRLADVAWVRPLPQNANGKHRLPEEMA